MESLEDQQLGIQYSEKPMRKPNFFIIGAPKCGTTSLAAWLAEHPNIYMSPIKEPHFFNVDGLRVITTLEKYEDLFKAAGPEHIAIGEASTHYLFSQEAESRILTYNPDAKFIVCLRNPIEMVQALHSERVWQGRETIKDFEKAWRMQEERNLGKNIPQTIKQDTDRLQYGAYCRLGGQLWSLYNRGHQSRTLPLLLDDIGENPRREYLKVLDFLEIPDDGGCEFPVYNRRKGTRYPFLAYMLTLVGDWKRRLGIKKAFGTTTILRKANTNTSRETRLSGELHEELKMYFKRDIDLLGKLLNRDLSGWLV